MALYTRTSHALMLVRQFECTIVHIITVNKTNKKNLIDRCSILPPSLSFLSKCFDYLCITSCIPHLIWLIGYQLPTFSAFIDLSDRYLYFAFVFYLMFISLPSPAVFFFLRGRTPSFFLPTWVHLPPSPFPFYP